jgi:hypothetical protein
MSGGFMNRQDILAGERQYLEALDDKRRPLEERLFAGDFASTVLERGYLFSGELAEIAYWKWYGAATRVQAGNSDDVVRRFSTAAIVHSDDPRLAAWILRHLHGVHTRMASAILAVLFPDEYTVMDVRAWSALDALGWAPDLQQVFGDQPVKDDYLNRCSVYELYLEACRAKAAEFDVSLRALDRFLYTRGMAS